MSIERCPAVSGEIDASKPIDPFRGRSYRTPGGAVGIYVGTTRLGRAWYAYDPCDFLELCEDFDRWEAGR